MEIDGYKIKQYEHGYELYEPYIGYRKGKINGTRESCIKHRVSYWPTLKSACVALLDRKSGKCEHAGRLIDCLQECSDKIEAAIAATHTKAGGSHNGKSGQEPEAHQEDR